MRFPAPLFVVLLLVGCPTTDDDDTTPPPVLDDDDSAAPDDDDSAVADDDDVVVPPELTTDEQVHGLELYATYCTECHGELLQGYTADEAPSLRNETFLATATDPFLASAITHGRPGTVMSAWGADYGGPIIPPDVGDLVSYIRAWQTAETVDVHDQVVEGDAELVRRLFSGNCSECHGLDGEGESGPSLNNPWFLETASDGFIRYAIDQGRPGTEMGAWGTIYPDFVLDGLTAKIRAWATPVDDSKVPPFDPDLTQPVINEGGPLADFTDVLLEGLYVPVADVAAAVTAGQALVLLDARPGSDYLSGHITGAVSVPFYRVDDAVPFLPEDAWLIAYCGCPHALSGDVAEQLAELGFDRVAVLDEGWFDWVAGGHPTTEGPSQY